MGVFENQNVTGMEVFVTKRKTPRELYGVLECRIYDALHYLLRRNTLHAAQVTVDAGLVAVDGTWTAWELQLHTVV